MERYRVNSNYQPDKDCHSFKSCRTAASEAYGGALLLATLPEHVEPHSRVLFRKPSLAPEVVDFLKVKNKSSDGILNLKERYQSKLAEYLISFALAGEDEAEVIAAEKNGSQKAKVLDLTPKLETARRMRDLGVLISKKNK